MKKMYVIILPLLMAANIGLAEDAKTEKQDAEVAAAVSTFANMDMATRIQLMKQFDKDGDGRLSKEEREAAMEALKNKSADLDELKNKHAEEIIKKYDTDGDGKLDQKELISFLEEQRKMFDEARARMRPGEMRGTQNLPKEVVAQYDKDGDGKLSHEERRAMFQDARKKRDEMMKKFDKDADGKLSDEEKTALVQSPEFQTMVKTMMGDGSRMTPPPPPPQE